MFIKIAAEYKIDTTKPEMNPALTNNECIGPFKSAGAKVMPEKQKAVKIPIHEPNIVKYLLNFLSLNKKGKTTKDGTNEIPTMKKANEKRMNEIRFDSPERAIVSPISLKKF